MLTCISCCVPCPCRAQVDPPEGWEWESTWQIDRGPATDADGWVYGPGASAAGSWYNSTHRGHSCGLLLRVSTPCGGCPSHSRPGFALHADFKSLHFPPPPGAHKAGVNDYVRRRRWVRRRRRVGGRQYPVAAAAKAAATKAASSLEAAFSGSGERRQESDVIIKQRQVLGRAAPGEALPLPLGWSAPGKQLQLRPVLPVAAPASGGGSAEAAPAAEQQQKEEPQEGQLPEAEGGQAERAQVLQAVHDWSHGTSGGWHTVALDSLNEGITRLVCCPALRSTRECPHPPTPPCHSPIATAHAKAAFLLPHRLAHSSLYPSPQPHKSALCVLPPACSARRSAGVCCQRAGGWGPVVQLVC